MTQVDRIRSLSDDELLRRLSAAAGRSRHAEAELVAHVAEVDRRRLYRREAASSMFAYCTERLHLSEHAAYLRITVARASREHPVLLAMLADGRLHLTAIAKLAPLLTAKNRDALLARATHRSKQRVEELIAEVAPKPPVAEVVRKLPIRAAIRAPGDSSPRAAAMPVTSRPPAGCSVELPEFTASVELRDKLERLRNLLPGADLAEAIDQAVTEKLARLEARRFAKTAMPRKALTDVDTTPSSRYIPAPVRRAVHARDGGRCTYTDASGRRCTATAHLEFHDDGRPYGRGGDHSPSNLRLLCDPHNALLAEREYGAAVMARHRRSTGRVSEPSASYSAFAGLHVH